MAPAETRVIAQFSIYSPKLDERLHHILFEKIQSIVQSSSSPFSSSLVHQLYYAELLTVYWASYQRPFVLLLLLRCHLLPN